MQARHKLAIKEHLEQSDFDLTLFEFKSEARFLIVLRHTELRFEVSQDPKNFNLFFMYQNEYKPGYPIIGPIGTNNNINKVFGQIDHWLKTVVHPYIQEVEFTEKWNSIESGKFFDGSFNSDPDDMSMLTEPEVNFLKSAVRQIKSEIRKEFEPTAELVTEIDKKLDYLIESTERLNRFDLKGTILNTMLSIGINLGVDTESGKALFKIFNDAFNSIPVLYETAKIFLQSKFGG